MIISKFNQGQHHYVCKSQEDFDPTKLHSHGVEERALVSEEITFIRSLSGLLQMQWKRQS
jgi:hypothetical protein